MDGNYFDHIAEEIFKQKQRMDQLEGENRRLREQLVDLRAGRGILVDIAGRRFALRDSSPARDSLAETR